MSQDHNDESDSRIQPIPSSIQAEAASAHARINIPLNLNNWKGRPEEEQAELLWFHQHLLDESLSWDDACKALGTSRTTIFRLLKGTYEAEDWSNQIGAIRSYRRIAEQRASIQRSEFAENPISRLIWAGLDYAMANGSITTITGESRQGKTVSVKAWVEANNHGRSVYCVVPPVGGTKGLMRAIAGCVGVNRNQSLVGLSESLYRAFNRNRILILDEAHRALPSDYRSNPANVELVRDIHDLTGCALAFVATERFSTRIKQGTYQFEQLIGRIGMPIRLPARIGRKDVLPIVSQYLSKPDDATLDLLVNIANQPGRLGIVVETLKVASRIAKKKKRPISSRDITDALDFRDRMTGTQD